MSDIRTQIRDEYNAIHAWIALHPYAASAAFFGLGVVAGWLFL